MAVVNAGQKINLALGFVSAAQHLAVAYATIARYNKLYVKSGLTFTDKDFDGTSLSYIDPKELGTLIINLVAFQTFMDTGGQGDLCFKVTPAQPCRI